MTDPKSALPESNPASPVPSSVTSAGTDGTGEHREMSHVPEEHREVLRRLHRRVEHVVDAIQQLRDENQRLRQRVEQLEAEPAFPDADTVLTFDEKPAELRKRITQFLETIDSYLESTPSSSSLDLDSDGASTNDSDV